jgi:hypothetical protein
MPYGWSTAGRLRPMRMVALRGGHCPEHELARIRNAPMYPRVRSLQSWNRVEDDRMRRRDYPRVLDEYGISRRPKC